MSEPSNDNSSSGAYMSQEQDNDQLIFEDEDEVEVSRDVILSETDETSVPTSHSPTPLSASGPVEDESFICPDDQGYFYLYPGRDCLRQK
jgi:hypothetical protein